MSIEAMKQALEALDGLSEPYDVLKAQEALRQAMNQAQRWAVFCAGCRKEWSVPYQHPGKSICTDCEARLKEQP